MNVSIFFAVISNILMPVAIIISWGLCVILFAICEYRGYKYENAFYRATTEVLSAKDLGIDRYCEGIKNNYEVYKYHKLGFKYKKIIYLSQETVEKIRLGNKLNSTQYFSKDLLASRLDCVIKMLQNEESYDDEKANEIITILKEKIDENSLNKIRERLKFLEGFHKGISQEKDSQIEDLKAKMKRKKWINWVAGILGTVGSIFTIITFFTN